MEVYHSEFYQAGRNIGLWLSISDDRGACCRIRITTMGKYSRITHPSGGVTLWNRETNRITSIY